MPAPAHDSASISSSGYSDGLGRRELAFDRETGTLLERLYVRTEIGVFEPDVRARVDRLQSLGDERFARPLAVEREAGRLVLVSEYVAGVRVSDLLEMPDALQDAPTLDLALAFLLEALPALATFHAVSGGPHALISSGRTVLTAAPNVVFLDGAFGDVIGRVHFSRSRLWREFGLAMPSGSGPAQFTVGTDIAQVALTALMLVIGRALREDEFPHALPTLVGEVADVALIRGSDAFAAGLRQFLETALPIGRHSAYRSAQDAHAEVRRVAELEMGADACRRALTGFLEQLDVGAEPIPSAAITSRAAFQRVAVDDDAVDIEDAGPEDASAEPAVLDGHDDVPIEPEVVLAREEEAPTLDLPTSYAPYEVHDRTPATDAEPFSAAPPTEDSDGYQSYSDLAPSPSYFDDASSAPAQPTTHVEPTYEPPLGERRSIADESWAAEPATADATESFVRSTETPFDAQPQDTFVSSFDEPAAATSDSDDQEGGDDGEAAADEQDAEPERKSFFSPRRKRGEKSRSARARKDRLRSAAAAFKESVFSRVTSHADAPEKQSDPPAEVAAEPIPPPPPTPALPPLIPATRAARFEPPIPEPAFTPAPPPAPLPLQVPAPVPIVPAAVAPTSPFPPVSPPPPPMPVFPGQPLSVTPSILTPPLSPPPPVPLPPPVAPPVPSIPLSPSTPSLKLKTPASLAHPVRRERTEPPPALDGPRFPSAQEDAAPRRFPIKLALVAVVLVLAGIVAGRAYLPDRKAEAEREAAAAAAAAAAAKLPPAKRGPGAVPSGKITIHTQPAGAKVLLDGLAAGQTPLTIDTVPAGRHVVTLISESGSVKRTVRVEAGQTVTIDEQIFGGWVAIFAPITFDVAEKGRAIGSTEEGRLMLSPGRHELTLTNKALGYSAVHTVDIEPGEVRSLTLEPKGAANFNAVPWAEVWVDDQKAGDTPIANLQLPLGVHNVVFKHPQYGERKLTVTVRANEPAVLSVDFNR